MSDKCQMNFDKKTHSIPYIYYIYLLLYYIMSDEVYKVLYNIKSNIYKEKEVV